MIDSFANEDGQQPWLRVCNANAYVSYLDADMLVHVRYYSPLFFVLLYPMGDKNNLKHALLSASWWAISPFLHASCFSVIVLGQSAITLLIEQTKFWSIGYFLFYWRVRKQVLWFKLRLMLASKTGSRQKIHLYGYVFLLVFFSSPRLCNCGMYMGTSNRGTHFICHPTVLAVCVSPWVHLQPIRCALLRRPRALGLCPSNPPPPSPDWLHVCVGESKHWTVGRGMYVQQG